MYLNSSHTFHNINFKSLVFNKVTRPECDFDFNLIKNVEGRIVPVCYRNLPSGIEHFSSLSAAKSNVVCHLVLAIFPETIIFFLGLRGFQFYLVEVDQ